MKIAIAGHRGFIGSSLVKSLEGNEIIFLDRKTIYSSPEVISERIDGADVLMNFAGYSVSKRWTTKNRKLIMASRVDVTRNLVQAVQHCADPPGKLIFASAIGIYSDSGTHSEERNRYGSGFLADVVKEWESAMDAEWVSDRMTILRIGLVLGRDGGAFPVLRRMFNLYAGAVLGNGKQVYSFIHIEDLIRLVLFSLGQKGLGVLNATAPHPVTNREFSKSLARSLGKPLFFRVPAFILKAMLGRSSTILLSGQQVVPERALQSGFEFKFPEIDQAMANLTASS